MTSAFMKQHVFLFCLIFTITKTIANGTDTTKIKCASAIDSLDHCRVYTIVDEPAEFPGSMSAFQKYIMNSLDAADINDCSYSKITIELIIDTLGLVRNACVTMFDFNEIVYCRSKDKLLKAVNDMPLWIPGRFNGKKVYTRFIVPIIITLR
jgi:hypothetical protein